MPEHTETAELGELGLRLVTAAVHDELRWIFRSKRKLDVGIDGEIELVNESRKPTGRLIAVQVKCGPSYTAETIAEGFVYRGDIDHLEYWLSHSLPVIVVICDSTTRQCHWAEVSTTTAVRLTRGWKMVVPFENRLDATAAWKLEQIANRIQIDDYLDAAVRNWLYEKYFQRIELCSWFERPSDCQCNFLAKIEGSGRAGIYYMYARYGIFEVEELREVLHFDRSTYQLEDRQRIVCLIAHSEQTFKLKPEFLAEMTNASQVDFVRMLVKTDPLFALNELTASGEIIDEYIRGEPFIYSRWNRGE